MENTIRNVCHLAIDGMRETDRTIIELMIHPCMYGQRKSKVGLPGESW